MNCDVCFSCLSFFVSAAAAASAHDEDDDVEQLRASIAGVVLWS